MGFNREVAVEALLMTGNSLEQATDFLVSRGRSGAGGGAPPYGRGQQALGILMDEEEQLAQAIAMSLQQASFEKLFTGAGGRVVSTLVMQ